MKRKYEEVVSAALTIFIKLDLIEKQDAMRAIKKGEDGLFELFNDTYLKLKKEGKIK